jgi:hypothetical protein
MRTWGAAVLVLLSVVLVPAVARAQASITGVVQDSSGAVLPGVTVEAASPALIEKVRTAVSDGSGQYRIIDLRPGTYTVTFTLPGFNTFKRDGIELTGTFTATVNAELRVGELAETITVTGESPIVDTQNTNQQRVLTKDVLDSIPAGRNATNFARLIPGMTGTNDIGGSNNLNLTSLAVHGGRTISQRVHIDGQAIGSASGAGESTNFQPDITSTQELSVTYAAGNAEQAFGGVQINLVPKEGGNTFKGSVFFAGANSSFQGHNLTDELKAQGLTATDRINVIRDLNPGMGGPIMRDKLWFFSAARWQATKTYLAGIWLNKNAGDPTKWNYDPDYDNQAQLPLTQWSANTRLTWQITPRNKVSGFHDEQGRKWDQMSATRSPEAPQHYDFPSTRLTTGAYSSPVTSKLLIDIRANAGKQDFDDRYPDPSNTNGPLEFGKPLPAVYKSLITVTEQGGIIPGLIYRGAGQSSATQPFIHNRSWVFGIQGAVSYVTGAHAMKFGVSDAWAERDVTYNAFDYNMTFRFNNGVPNQLTQQATPYRFINKIDGEFGVFAQDRWTIKRLTINAGLRYDSLQMNFPESHLGPGLLVPTRDITLPYTEYIRWKDIQPRIGVVYDLFGTGKTAVKANMSDYVIPQRTSNDYSTMGNPVNALAQLVPRSWNDSTFPVGDPRRQNYWPDCDLLNPLANGECGQLTDVNFGKPIASTQSDTDMTRGWNKRPKEREYELSVQHQLMPRLGLDVGYFRREFSNFTVVDNRAVGPENYSPYSITAPVDPRLPDGGGYVISGLQNLNPDKVGQVNNLFTLARKYGDQYEHWNGVDVSMNYRPAPGIMVQGGTSTGRTSTDNCEVVRAVPESAIAGSSNSPLYCHVDTPYLTQFKMIGTYTVPKVDVLVAATVTSLPGPTITSNYVASNALIQPSLGRPLSGGAANVTIGLVSPGEMYGDRINSMDLRLQKIFRFEDRRLNVGVDIYNALNASDPVTLNNNYATWLRPQQILLPRFAKISVMLDF